MLITRLNEINCRLEMLRETYPATVNELVELMDERDELIEVINLELEEQKKVHGDY